jgi:hypothetical protein
MTKMAPAADETARETDCGRGCKQTWLNSLSDRLYLLETPRLLGFGVKGTVEPVAALELDMLSGEPGTSRVVDEVCSSGG